MSDINMSVNIAGVELQLLPEHSVQAWSMGNMLILTDLVQ